MFALYARSLDGKRLDIDVKPETTIATLRKELERALPPFHEMRLLHGTKELGDGDAIEIEVQAVAMKWSADKIVEALCVHWNASKEKVKQAIAALDDYPDLDQSSSDKIVELLLGPPDGQWDTRVALAEVFGRRCSNPDHMRALKERLFAADLREGAVCNWGVMCSIIAISEMVLSHVDSVDFLSREAPRYTDRATSFLEEAYRIIVPQVLAEIFRGAVIAAIRLLGCFGESEQEHLLARVIARRRSTFLVSCKEEAQAALLRIQSRHDQQALQVASQPQSSDSLDAPLVKSSPEVESETIVLIPEAEAQTDPLMEEQRDLQEALMRSKADRPAPICYDDSVVIFRLTRCCKNVFRAICESTALMEARKRVEEAGCSLFPNYARGACLLVPLAHEQYSELGLQLEKYHIVALRSDKFAIEEALRMVPQRARPKLRDDHRADTRTIKESNAIQEIDLLRPQLHEIAQLHPRIRELVMKNIEISEPSVVAVSAPCGEGSSAQPLNPRHYDLK